MSSVRWRISSPVLSPRRSRAICNVSLAPAHVPTCGWKTTPLPDWSSSGLTKVAGAFSFDSLSAGTKEQMAAAVRLAMAEVLAESSDNCLPVVFDDAFAYSDPDRVTILQRMLDRAAARGLQIIVLSCNPSDYATLGAKSILLRAEPGPPS